MQCDDRINNLQISSDIIDKLLDEFDESINSKRLKSQIKTIAELIRVLWNRNLFRCDANAKHQILKCLKCKIQQDIVHEHIASLHAIDNFDGSQNVYAKVRDQSSDKQSSSSCEHQSNQNQRSSSTSKCSHGLDEDQRQKIFEIVCDDIDAWQNFGRCLGFRDTELKWMNSDMSLQHDMKIKMLTNRLLEQTEKKFPNEFKQKLCTALQNADRNDILRKLYALNLI